MNILIKLMSIISLTIAPLLSANPGDWDTWYYGIIPLALMIIGTFVVYWFFWRDLADITADIGIGADAEGGKGEEEAAKKEEETPDENA